MLLILLITLYCLFNKHCYNLYICFNKMKYVINNNKYTSFYEHRFFYFPKPSHAEEI